MKLASPALSPGVLLGAYLGAFAARGAETPPGPGKAIEIHAGLWRLYCDRGTAQSFIEQLKNALEADRLSCRRFVANAFRLIQFALACNLMRVLGSKLRETVLEGATIETIRTRLLKVGARVRRRGRRTVHRHRCRGAPSGRTSPQKRSV